MPLVRLSSSSLFDIVFPLKNNLFFSSLLAHHKYISNMSSNTSTKRELEDCTENDDKIAETPVKPIRRTKRFKIEFAVLNNPLDVSDYYIENGLRKVYPYIFNFHSFAKGRWVGEKMIELFAKEFRGASVELMREKSKNGSLKVNDETVDVDYVLKENDFITNRVHRHEIPILAAPIPILHLDNNVVVIDKPPSLPVHPCGKYRLNTITSILEKENNLKNLHVIHRLDRLTSGIMILGRNKAHAQKLHESVRNREMGKEYVCRVEGEFPKDTIECDKSLSTLNNKLGICIVDPEGKESKTIFERMNYNGKSSTVLCKPLTGRMHQIRVHLQYLGYPIVNDPFYNSLAFGPNKGKGGVYGKSLEQLMKDVDDEHLRTKYIERNETKDESDVAKDGLENEKDIIAIKAMEHYTSQESWQEISKRYQFDPSKIGEKEPDCAECLHKSGDPLPREQFIYLHALRYKSDLQNWSFETQMPVWAKDDWMYD